MTDDRIMEDYFREHPGEQIYTEPSRTPEMLQHGHKVDNILKIPTGHLFVRIYNCTWEHLFIYVMYNGERKLLEWKGRVLGHPIYTESCQSFSRDLWEVPVVIDDNDFSLRRWGLPCRPSSVRIFLSPNYYDDIKI